jgi:Tfp pilus assembly protein PilF
LAELDFAYGDIPAARRSAACARSIAPRSGQILVLEGFLLAADNRLTAAVDRFDRAILQGGRHANAWLGRGLCRIRQGDRAGGQRDLQVAAALDPGRATLRSYLGRAWNVAGKNRQAERELRRAVELDPRDPTPWLYLALLDIEEHRGNAAIENLRQSIERNDDRSLFRSRLLLDEDRAMRGANLALVYSQTGLEDLALQEAARAVTTAYDQYDAHQFLAQTYNTLRDPTRVDLRFESVWFSEFLLANLLAPAGAGPLSPKVSQQEYSRLLEVDRAGLHSETTVRSDRQFEEIASQYGRFRSLSYALDLDYQHNDGVRPNNDLDRLEWHTRVKYDLSPQDSLFLFTRYYDYTSGDVRQYYNPDRQSLPDYRQQQQQQPNVLVGYHREWQPGILTLILAGQLQGDQQLAGTQNNPVAGSGLTTARMVTFPRNYANRFRATTAEVNQMIRAGVHRLVGGCRYQTGGFDIQDDLPALIAGRRTVPTRLSWDAEFEHAAGYLYYTWCPEEPLALTAGLA